MNVILPWVVALALLVTLFAVVNVTLKERKEHAAEVNRLTTALNSQKKICEELSHYAQEIVKINGDKDNVAQKIEEAKNDEEVLSVIAGLVSANNDRVRK